MLYLELYFAVMQKHAVITLVFPHSDNYIYPSFPNRMHVKKKNQEG